MLHEPVLVLVMMELRRVMLHKPVLVLVMMELRRVMLHKPVLVLVMMELRLSAWQNFCVRYSNTTDSNQFDSSKRITETAHGAWNPLNAWDSIGASNPLRPKPEQHNEQSQMSRMMLHEPFSSHACLLVLLLVMMDILSGPTQTLCLWNPLRLSAWQNFCIRYSNTTDSNQFDSNKRITETAHGAWNPLNAWDSIGAFIQTRSMAHQIHWGHDIHLTHEIHRGRMKSIEGMTFQNIARAWIPTKQLAHKIHRGHDIPKHCARMDSNKTAGA
jgi:hypothetical protein